MQLCTNLRMNVFSLHSSKLKDPLNYQSPSNPIIFVFPPRGRLLITCKFYIWETHCHVNQNLYFFMSKWVYSWCVWIFFYLPFSQILRSNKDSRYETKCVDVKGLQKCKKSDLWVEKDLDIFHKFLKIY